MEEKEDNNIKGKFKQAKDDNIAPVLEFKDSEM